MQACTSGVHTHPPCWQADTMNAQACKQGFIPRNRRMCSPSLLAQADMFWIHSFKSCKPSPQSLQALVSPTHMMIKDGPENLVACVHGCKNIGQLRLHKAGVQCQQLPCLLTWRRGLVSICSSVLGPRALDTRPEEAVFFCRLLVCCHDACLY